MATACSSRSGCSLGERSRLQLARLVLRGCNLLLLDEPINHLDVESREHFEAALDAFEAASWSWPTTAPSWRSFSSRMLELRDGAAILTYVTPVPYGLVGWRSTLTLFLITASILGFVTAITMIGPLLLDLSRELGVPLGQAGAARGGDVAAVGARRAVHRAAVRSPRPAAADRPGPGRRRRLDHRRSAFATSFATLLAARFAAGMFGAFGPASVMAAVGDLFPPRRRGMAMGWLNAGFGLAAVAGVPVVGIVGGLFGWRWAFASPGRWCWCWPCWSNWPFPHQRRSQTGGSLRQTYAAVLGVPLLGNVLAANLLERSIFNAALLYLPSFLMLNYGLGAADVAPALALVAIGTIVGNTFGGWLGDRFPARDDLRRRPTGRRRPRAGAVRTGAGLVVSVVLARPVRHDQRHQPTRVSGARLGAVAALSGRAARAAVADQSGRHGARSRRWAAWRSASAATPRWRC